MRRPPTIRLQKESDMRRLHAVIPVLILLGGAAGQATAADPLLAPAATCRYATTAGASAAHQERAMSCLVTWARRKAGIAPGRRLAALNRSAQMKADLIARCGTLSHTACGTRWDAGLRSVGSWRLTFENLQSGSGRYATARAAMTGWLRSPGHRHALLESRVTVFGVGVRLRAMVNGWRGSVWALHLARP
jgi:uncharacterized protein YkwD